MSNSLDLLAASFCIMFAFGAAVAANDKETTSIQYFVYIALGLVSFFAAAGQIAQVTQ